MLKNCVCLESECCNTPRLKVRLSDLIPHLMQRVDFPIDLDR